MIKKSILITGAGKRLGLEFAKTSLNLGFSVVIHYRTTAEPAKMWLAKNRDFYGKVTFVQGDLNDLSGNIFEICKKEKIKLCGLVNSASIFEQGNISDYENFTKHLFVNSMIPVKLAMGFVSFSKRGWIINVTDSLIEPLNINFQNYRISKLLLTELTRQMAFTYAPDIRVNAIAPGSVLPPNTLSKEEKKRFGEQLKSTPLSLKLTTKSIMNAYKYLIENNNITGEIINIDNGRHLI